MIDLLIIVGLAFTTFVTICFQILGVKSPRELLLAPLSSPFISSSSSSPSSSPSPLMTQSVPLVTYPNQNIMAMNESYGVLQYKPEFDNSNFFGTFSLDTSKPKKILLDIAESKSPLEAVVYEYPSWEPLVSKTTNGRKTNKTLEIPLPPASSPDLAVIIFSVDVVKGKMRIEEREIDGEKSSGIRSREKRKEMLLRASEFSQLLPSAVQNLQDVKNNFYGTSVFSKEAFIWPGTTDSRVEVVTLPITHDLLDMYLFVPTFGVLTNKTPSALNWEEENIYPGRAISVYRLLLGPDAYKTDKAHITMFYPGMKGIPVTFCIHYFRSSLSSID